MGKASDRGPNSPLRPRRGARLLLLLAAFAPALLAALLVQRHAVDVPVWDDWERAKLVEAWQEDRLDLAYLYSPHIDHRILIPRLVALANARLFASNLVLEMWLAWGVVLATALLVHALLRASIGVRPALYGLTFLANLLLFSPLQWENFLWAAQPWFLFPATAACGALFVLQSRLALPVRFAVCLLLAAAATHTFSHGLALWGLVPAFVVLRRQLGARRARFLFLAAWLFAAVTILVPYFTVGGLRNTSEPGHAFELPVGERAPGLSPRAALADPVRVARFFTSMLGSQLARTTLYPAQQVAPWAGALLAALFAVPALYALWRCWRIPRQWDRWLPWLALGGYGAGLCALASLGRAGLTKWSYALLPHYVSIALYLPLASLVLWVLLLDDLASRIPRERAAVHALLRRALPVLAGLCVGVQGFQWLIGAAGMKEWESARLQARTALLFVNHFPPEQHRFDTDLATARRLANVLNRYGQLHPPLLEEPSLAPFGIAEAALDPRDARIDKAALHGGHAVLRGHAWLAEAGRRADGVLFTVEGGGERAVVGVAELHGLVEVVVPEHDHIFNEVSRPGPEMLASWRGELDLARLPDGDALRVRAWAVDARRMRVHPFAEPLLVRRGPGGASLRIVAPGEAAP